jgi:hypothetical protein
MKLMPRPLFITAFLLMVVSVTVCFKADNTDFEHAREIIVMRSIGHQILLSSGDSSSRVLPITKTGDNQYHIRFENTLKFTPDSVVKIIGQAIKANNLPSDYIVNVVQCQNNQVIFGFAILQTEQTNLMPCRGRQQPKACYAIEITFRDTALGALNKNYFVGAGGGLTALILVLGGIRISSRQKKPAGSVVNPPLINSEIIAIGNYKFHKANRYLEYGQEQIELSAKESKLLYILAGKLNELVERDELQKVWEDEGVIVGRSLDVFISKLRKKLENDPTVRLVNVHGKGYKLEIN